MAKLTPVVIDMETFWSSSHSLTRLNPIEYVMHPETEIISCAAKTNGRQTHVTFGEDEVRKGLNAFDWSDKLVIAHNMSGFDAMILAWRFGVRPAMWGCTLAMSKPHHMKDAGGSLAKLVEHYNIGVKDSTALVNTKGKHLEDFTPDEIDAMRTYNAADVDQCWELFKIFLPLTSKQEMKLIDMTIRMLVEPEFVVDRKLLEATLKEERARKSQVLLDLATMIGAYQPGMEDEDAIEAVCKTLGSAAKFGKLLTDLGVEVPYKPSPTNPEKQTPALAKTDEAFVALTESEDPIVAAAAQARLGVKSTLLESRITAFLEASDAAGGKLPVPLTYFGGHTGRWCLAEGTPVLVRDMNGAVYHLPIQEVSHHYEVWDGAEWVRHDGVEYSGDKEVITWDGVTATPEHIVWVASDTKVSLGYAATNALALWKGDDVPDLQTDSPVWENVHRVD